MELYSTLVPHLHSANTDLYRAILKEIDVQHGHKHLPKIWTDLQESKFCSTGIESRMGISQRFAASMTYADIPIFTDFDDPEKDEKLSLLKVRFL